jgi:hypothetical protein
MAMMPDTRWSLIDRLRTPASPADREAAWRELMTLYRPALEGYAGRHAPPGEADDVVQSFAVEFLVQWRLFERADRTRGRLRSLIFRMLRQHIARAHAAKKLGASLVSLDESTDQDASAAGAGVDTSIAVDEEFDAAWARQTLRLALERMRAECDRTGRRDLYAVFDGRLLRKMRGEPEVSVSEMAGRLGVDDAKVSNLLVAAKRMFDRTSTELLLETCAEDEVDAERTYLQSLLARHGSVPSTQ